MAIGLAKISTQDRAGISAPGKVRASRWIGLAVVLAIAPTLSACNGASQTLSLGYQINQDTVDLVPVGSSREQVLLALGSPSTTINQPDEVYYYISQTKKRRAAFSRARVVSQSVLAVYFDKEQTVNNIANYSLKDGKVFDAISRTTPTGGRDLTFIGQILGAATGPINPFGGS